MNQPRVLVVDDDPALATNVAELVADLGFDVHVEASAEAGLDRLLEHSYQCLVTDLVLPGQRGIEMIEAVLRVGASLPCVLLTGHWSEAIAHQALSSGAYAVVEKSKPGWIDELTSAITTAALGGSRTMRRVAVLEAGNG